MNISLRHQEILHRIKVKGHVTVADLARELQVSEVTVRKDLNYLEGKKLLFRHHGGASINNPYVLDRPISQKQLLNAKEKKSIAKKAASFIEENDVVVLGSGTTVFSMMSYIPKELSITVITSSLLVAASLCKFENIHIINIGGTVRHSSQSTVGQHAQEMMSQLSANKLFLGVYGVDEDFGVSTSNTEEAFLNKVMIKNSNKTFLLLDSTKFGKKGLGKICDLQEVDALITNMEIDDVFEKTLKKMGISVYFSED